MPVFIPEANISHMVQTQQQSSIENLVGSVEHGRSVSIRNDYEVDEMIVRRSAHLDSLNLLQAVRPNKLLVVIIFRFD